MTPLWGLMNMVVLLCQTVDPPGLKDRYREREGL